MCPCDRDEAALCKMAVDGLPCICECHNYRQPAVEVSNQDADLEVYDGHTTGTNA
jgi:hypothetical protein